MKRSGRKRSLGLWYRFYVSILDDPKLERLSDAVYRTWTKLNAVATLYEGMIPGDIKTLVVKLRKPPSTILAHLETLIESKLLEKCGDDYSPHDWEEWQYDSDVSTKRVRAFRERKRNVSETADETFQKDELKRSKNVSETNMKRPQSHSTEIEKESPPTPPLKRNVSKNPLNGHQSDFKTFYETYPKHEARKDAEKAYAAAIKSGADPPALLAAVQRYAASRRGEDPKFTPLPATWLRAGRWLDGEAELVDPAKAEADRERADKLLKRGKYAETH